MKYNQPYGMSDPNAAYVNGDPSTGTQGSIPPAASIEYPQREIANFETDSGLTPTNADLHQLSKSVQSGKVNYSLDQGTPNFLAITPTPALTSYQIGQYFRIKVANNNTGPSNLNVSNVGFAPLVRGDKSAMGSGELLATQMIDVTFDGTNWQMMAGSSASGGLIAMTSARNLYLNASTGDDTLYDGSQATVDAVNKHGPFRTLTKAIAVMLTYNLSGFTFNINFADGIYSTSTPVALPSPNGSGTVALRGNPGNPFNVQVINPSAGSALSCNGGNYYVDGLYMAGSNPGTNDYGNGCSITGAGSVFFASCAFGACAGYHIISAPGGSVGISGPVHIYGGGTAHCAVQQNGIIQTLGSPRPTMNIHNAVTFTSGFVAGQGGGQMIIVYASITGAASVTGPRYNAFGNAVINTGGSGASYYPGTVVGSVASGGQYI